jgi:hypothetical protein
MGLRSKHLPFINECFHEYKDPEIIKNFISHEDCDYIINMCKNELEPSEVGNGIVATIRVSKSAGPDIFDSVIKNFRLKCAIYKNIPITLLEQTQVTCYNTGGFYDFHKDDERSENGELILNRKFTFIIALNDDYEGGETEFPEINKTYKLNKGDSLFFYVQSGIHKTVSNMGIHAGKIVTKNKKWILNQWVLTQDRSFYDRFWDIIIKCENI